MKESTCAGPEFRTCMLCGGSRHRPVFHEFGNDIHQCCDCGHAFSSYAANPHHDGFWGDEVVKDEHFYWSRARASMHKDFSRRFLVGRSGRLLDVGCGLGFFLKAIAVHDMWESYGYEISPAAVRYARESLGLTNVLCGRPEEAEFPPGSFDIITMWDVLEHFQQPEPLLQKSHVLLRVGGICFIHTPNFSLQLLRARFLKLLLGMQHGVAYLQARDHLHHYSTGSIRMLLERSGFSNVEFIHLRPAQSISGSKSRLLRCLKNAWFEASRAISFVSGGFFNFDNLFVVARKDSRVR